MKDVSAWLAAGWSVDGAAVSVRQASLLLVTWAGSVFVKAVGFRSSWLQKLPPSFELRIRMTYRSSQFLRSLSGLAPGVRVCWSSAA